MPTLVLIEDWIARATPPRFRVARLWSSTTARSKFGGRNGNSLNDLEVHARSTTDMRPSSEWVRSDATRTDTRG
jgi:hypothetical protein